jgi:hypothetical protein
MSDDVITVFANGNSAQVITAKALGWRYSR